MKKIFAINIIVIVLLTGYVLLGFAAHADTLSKQDKNKEYETISNFDNCDQLKQYAQWKIGLLISYYNGCKSALDFSMALSLACGVLLTYNLICMIRYQRKDNLSQKPLVPHKS